MKKRILGRTGLEISVVGFGGIPIQGLDCKEAERVLLASLDGGIDFIDTARGYTDSEEKIGRALAGGRRKKVVLATKALSRDARGMTEELETSLRNLKTSINCTPWDLRSSSIRC
jgi:aryl-alcohol dehydrogenase-like predicted oxidoreductase